MNDPPHTAPVLIVTGLVDGVSAVIERRNVTPLPGAIELWRTRLDVIGEGPGADRNGPAAFYPAERGEAFWRLLTLPPEPDAADVDPEVVSEAFFNSLGIPECRVDTRRHPTMHRTPTVDFVILLAGDLILLVDQGEPVRLKPHDMVVQRGTNHAWINPGSTPAVLLVALLGAPAQS